MPRKTFVPSAAEEAEARQASPEAGPSSVPDPDKPKKKIHRSSKKLSAKRKRAKAIENGEIVLPDPLTLEEEREKQQARNQAKADKQKRKDTGETGAGYIQPEGEIEEGGVKRKVGWGRDEGIASELYLGQHGEKGTD